MELDREPAAGPLLVDPTAVAALEFSEPEPDFSVVPAADYDLDHPRQAYLIIEG